MKFTNDNATRSEDSGATSPESPKTPPRATEGEPMMLDIMVDTINDFFEIWPKDKRIPRGGLTFETIYKEMRAICLPHKNKSADNKKVFLFYFKSKTKFKMNFQAFVIRQKIKMLSIGIRDIDDDTLGYDVDEVSPFFWYRVSTHTHTHPTPPPHSFRRGPKWSER